MVAAGLARRCEVQIAYAIGVAKPVAVRLDTFGTGKVTDAELERAVLKTFDLSPLGIIRDLGLRRPLYLATSVFGHFGRTDIDLPWEHVGRSAQLRNELG